MVRLTRTVRFCINPHGGPGVAASAHASNGTGGVPAMVGIGAYYELDAECVAAPDPTTGYLINIKHIDHAVRRSAVPIIAEAIRTDAAREPATLLPDLSAALRAELPALSRIRWRLTPSHSVEMETSDMTRAVLRQSFEIAAAHRLHVEALSDDDNQRVFGKCNNPNGHGHNYRFEPAIEIDIDSAEGGAAGWSLADLEAITDEVLISRFDHKHLNLDTPEFGPGGLNPSVENIARVFFDLLAPQILEQSGGRATLRAITVWETEKTSCTYPASPHN